MLTAAPLETANQIRRFLFSYLFDTGPRSRRISPPPAPQVFLATRPPARDSPCGGCGFTSAEGKVKAAAGWRRGRPKRRRAMLREPRAAAPVTERCRSGSQLPEQLRAPNPATATTRPSAQVPTPGLSAPRVPTRNSTASLQRPSLQPSNRKMKCLARGAALDLEKQPHLLRERLDSPTRTLQPNDFQPGTRFGGGD